MVEELLCRFPMWLEYSGLPAMLTKEVRTGAWSVFKKLVEIDCLHNAEPDTFEVSVAELSELVGLKPATVKNILIKLRRKKLIVCFLPEEYEEEGLFKINVPLPTPLSAKRVKRKYARLFPPGRDFFRYADKHITETDGDDPELQELIDIYLNTIGLKINIFIIDELRLIKERFDIRVVKEVFAQARERKIKTLRWIVRKLMLEEKKRDECKKKRKEKRTRGGR
ncbi:hypothetical protein J7M23_09845 [Candidatus Sumerlaeota bacterium]|nr:hypothetical protein [Candidatus Sumerlaeota bacterium]